MLSTAPAQLTVKLKILQCGCIICISIVTGLVANYGTPDNTNTRGAIAAIVFMFFFVTCYASTTDVSSYIYCSEIFPTHIRAQGVGFATSGVLLMNTILLTSAGTAFKNIGWKFYLVFILVPASALPIIAKYFPETKGLSLEAVGALFGNEVAVEITNTPEDQRLELDRRLDGSKLIEKKSLQKQDGPGGASWTEIA